MICRKATIMLPGANPLSSRAQNRSFCALLGTGTPVFEHFEHKIRVFVSEWAIFPLFSALQSTKSAFLCSSYRRVGLEVVNVGLGKRKARRFWVCALLLICLAARSAVLPEVPFYSERRSTWSASPPPAGQETKSRGTKGRGTKAGERRAGGFTGGRG